MTWRPVSLAPRPAAARLAGLIGRRVCPKTLLRRKSDSSTWPPITCCTSSQHWLSHGQYSMPRVRPDTCRRLFVFPRRASYLAAIFQRVELNIGGGGSRLAGGGRKAHGPRKSPAVRLGWYQFCRVLFGPNDVDGR
ncbi:hypothetical protein Zmor_019432 [Zophobas morio]|uniref:Uncharacterized protein n=1 Tax=Zophobas morio TaxID=2755281 RepID=A0AA38I3I8_9CUCU|nr:hypothetical protein Zmor_019432 [Zophobas morio]